MVPPIAVAVTNVATRYFVTPLSTDEYARNLTFAPAALPVVSVKPAAEKAAVSWAAVIAIPTLPPNSLVLNVRLPLPSPKVQVLGALVQLVSLTVLPYKNATLVNATALPEKPSLTPALATASPAAAVDFPAEQKRNTLPESEAPPTSGVLLNVMDAVVSPPIAKPPANGGAEGNVMVLAVELTAPTAVVPKPVVGLVLSYTKYCKEPVWLMPVDVLPVDGVV